MNKHQTNKDNGVTEIYMEKVLGHTKKCPKRSCHGICVEVWVKYKDHGPINYEWECCNCGKVIRDYQFNRRR